MMRNIHSRFYSYMAQLIRPIPKQRRIPNFILNTTIMTALINYENIKNLIFVNCEEKERRKFQFPELKEISPKYIIEQSCINIVNSTVQLLHNATATTLNAFEIYKKAMEAEMLLLNKSLEFVNVEFIQHDFNDLLIETRADIQKSQKELQELLSFMEYVEKTANSTAETSYLGGAEYSSLSVSEILYDALRRISEQKVIVQTLETELRSLQQKIILKTKERKLNKPSNEDTSNVTDNTTIE